MCKGLHPLSQTAHCGRSMWTMAWRIHLLMELGVEQTQTILVDHYELNCGFSDRSHHHYRWPSLD
jgi:hypothetical protein